LKFSADDRRPSSANALEGRPETITMTEEIYNLSEIYREEDTLTDRARVKKVFFGVSLCHVLFIAGPFFFFAIWEKFYDKKPLPMQVSLLNFNPDGNKNEPPGNPETPKNENKNNKKEEPQPEEAVEEAPVETPKKPIVEPPVKTEKVKVPVEKPVVKPPEIKEPVKKWEPKKATEIVKSEKVVKGKPPTPKINANDLASRLKKIQNQCKITNTTGGGGGPGLPGGIGTPGGAGTMPASYYDAVSVYLYDLWDQPGKAELKGLKPTVTVHISIDASGNVRSAQITKKSGNQAMDTSVEEMVSKLKTLPKPPQGAMEMDVSMEIED